MSKILHDNNYLDAKAIAIPQVFSKNIQAKSPGYKHFLLFPQCFFFKVFFIKVILNSESRSKKLIRTKCTKMSYHNKISVTTHSVYKKH